MQDAVDEGFVLKDGLSFIRLRFDKVRIKGRVHCMHGLFVDTDKFLVVRETGGRQLVKTDTYSYHAGIEGRSARTIFQYDNFHAYTREGHPDAHHKHRFDPTTWQEITPPEWVSEDAWPHLSDVLAELRDWWETTGRFLDLEQ